MKNSHPFLSLVALLCLATATATAQPQAPQLGSAPVDEVVQALTLEEKITLLVGGEMGGNAATVGATGVTRNLVPGAAGTTNAIPRLGIPAIVLADGPAGLRIQPVRENDPQTYYCTAFPIATLLASTWNTDLVEQVGQSIGREVKEYGVDVLLAPALNIQRDPLCGRNFEYYSEDPLLTGKIAASFVRGVQSNGVGTSIKHFAANNQETNRMATNAIISERALREIYLRAFEMVVKEAKPWTVMTSYNYINGVYASESRTLLTDILRKEWGFSGVVMTDWFGGQKAAAQVHAGNDLLMPGRPNQYDEIRKAVQDGTLSEKDIDTNVRRILQLILASPRFRKYAYSNKPDLHVHAGVTRRSAAEGMVLLENRLQALPFDASVRTIAAFGTTSYDFIAGGSGAGDVNEAYTVSLAEGLSNAGYRLDEAVCRWYEDYRASEAAKVKSLGSNPHLAFFNHPRLGEKVPPRKLLQRSAKTADVAILTLGRNAGEYVDRKIENDFELTSAERALLQEVCRTFHEAGKKVVVILNVCGAVETASWKSLPDAVLLAWQAGQEGGNTVADILKGTVNPSGKLPMTFPVHYMDMPSSANFPYDYQADPEQIIQGIFTNRGLKHELRNVDYTEYAEGIFVGYRYFDTYRKAVSYPFGYGLSYTGFGFGSLSVRQAGESYTVSVDVTNTGRTAGKEVVQVYVKAPEGKLKKPEKELKGFAKTRLLQPGETQTLHINIPFDALASYDEARHTWITETGTYRILLGTSTDHIIGTAEVVHRGIQDRIAALTLDEKLRLLVGTSLQRSNPPQPAPGTVVRHNESWEGINTWSSRGKVQGSAGEGYAVPRLDIPALVYADGPAGLRIDTLREGDGQRYYATAFPIATLLASSWNTPLVEEVGRAMGDEVRQYGVDILLAPGINIHRNPLTGRNFEYYSEDPLVAGKMASALIRGIQSNGVGTSLKHFAANNQETYRNGINVVVGERALREIYLKGFEIAIREARPWTVMTSYNKINNEYASESCHLLQDILRKEWGFDGFVMTDWWAEEDPVKQMIAGNNLLMPGTPRQIEELRVAVQSGRLSMQIIDRNVEDILRVMQKSPSQQQFVCSNRPDLEAHATVVRKAASEGMILLENREGTLPFRPEVKRIAAFGRSTYDLYIGGSGSGYVNRRYKVSLPEAFADAGYTVDGKLASTYRQYIAGQKAQLPLETFWEFPLVPEMPVSKKEVERLARETDIAVITLGRNSGEGTDRRLEKGDYYLNDTESELLHRVCEAFHRRQKQVVVVLNIGGVMHLSDWKDLPDALLLAWQPGQEAGHSIVDVLTGQVNPSGKLPVTFPMDYRDVPSASNFPMSNGNPSEVVYEEGIFVGYRHYDSKGIKPLYPFGYGLSYTRFKMDRPVVVSSEEGYAILVDVTNTGNLPGKEVVQLYVEAPPGSLVKPEKELRAFAKTKLLAPGETQRLSLNICKADLASYDESRHAWVTDTGRYRLQIGNSVANIVCSTELAIP